MRTMPPARVTTGETMGDLPDYFYRQSGVIPYRRTPDGYEILLVTTRSGKRWIIPKGVVEPDLTPRSSAETEAYEEAGIRGDTSGRSAGSYSYEKWGGTCTVEVFPMAVTDILDEWPESFRSRCWMHVDEAAASVREPGLARLIRLLPDLVG